MRLWALGLGLMAWGIGNVAYAEAWSDRLAFESGTASCATFQTVDYSFSLEGTSFTVSNQNGKMLTTTVPASGDVNQNFKSSSGSSLNITGNVRSKNFTITNTTNGCKWKTVAKR
jgi:hypothetical protein